MIIPMRGSGGAAASGLPGQQGQIRLHAGLPHVNCYGTDAAVIENSFFIRGPDQYR